MSREPYTYMKVVIVDAGGRGEALRKKLSESPRVAEIVMIPGNAGAPDEDRREMPKTFSELVALIVAEKPDMVVVGSEVTLVSGIKDALALHDILVFGPSAHCAHLEGSKLFAKGVCRAENIPTADFTVARTAREAEELVTAHGFPVVIKASGLCAGKGVAVANTYAEASAFIRVLMETHEVYAAVEKRLIIEDVIEGPEYCVMGLTNGREVKLLPVARDYKRLSALPGAPNTGGMGAYAPVPECDEAFLERVRERFFEPTLAALRRVRGNFTGVMYAGLKGSLNDPKLLEWNVRFGDPECQALLPLIDADLMDYMLWTNGIETPTLRDGPIPLVRARTSVCVVMAAEGYPGAVRTGNSIAGFRVERYLPSTLGHVLHAGTKREADQVLTAGGRVLNAVGLGKTVGRARDVAYAIAHVFDFEGKQMRGDIAEGLE